MDALESLRGYVKREPEESPDIKADRVDDEDDWESVDKKKHRSSKSRSRHGNAEDAEEWENGKRKNSGDRGDGRKKSGGSGRADSGDEEDYDMRKESRAKVVKKNQEEKNEKKSSSGYQDREMESNRRSSRDIDGGKGYLQADDSDRGSSRKPSTKPSLHEGSQSKTRSKVDTPHDSERDKAQDRDSRYSERKESSRDKPYGTREQERNPRRRWDESDAGRKAEESSFLEKSDSRIGKPSDHKHGTSRERNFDARIESGESKSRLVDSSNDRGVKSTVREEKRADGDRSKSRGRSEVREEDSRAFTTTREDKLDNVRDDKHRARDKWGGSAEDVESSARRMSSREDKNEKQRPQRDHARGSRADVESRERSVNVDEDRLRERNLREIRRTKRSRSPERSGRHRQPSDEFDRAFSESDNERSIGLRGKERDKEGYRDDRPKVRDSGSWDERNRDWEGSKDNWKRRHQTRHDKETKDGDGDFDYDKEWDSHRRERERLDSDKVHGRTSYRKDRGRTEMAKNSSYGAANEKSDAIEVRPKLLKSDAIEVRPKLLDYGREEPVRRPESGVHQDFTSVASDEEWGYLPEDRSRVADIYGPADDMQDTYLDDDNLGTSAGRNYFDPQVAKGRGQKGIMNSNRSNAGQASSNVSLPSFVNNQGSGSFNRAVPQGSKGGRPGRGSRGRLTGRDGQRVGIPLPLMGPPPFGHIGLPPGPMQPLGPNMSPAPGPPIGPGVFIPPYPGPPIIWPGARGVDMNMLAVQPGLSPVPPGPSGPRFASNVGTGPNPPTFYNQPGPGRGVSPGPGFNGMGPIGRGVPHEKAPMGWGPPRTSGPPGKAPSRGEQNDYSQNFVDTGMRPQNFIRELELTSVVEDYPKLRELIQKKDEIVSKSASPPMYYKCDLHEHVLSPEFFGTKFDVILVDPPWEEYVHRAPGVTDHMEYWTFEEIQNLKIEAIADTPSFIFLWVGDAVGLEQGRLCLKKWGFRRCEDICWVKTNKTNATPGLRHDSHTLFQHSKEHCLMGIKGTVRRSTDGHIIHANIDTDIIIAEEPPYGSTKKPEDLYRIIEHFSLGRRRLELFGEDHNIRSGWLTVGKGLSSSNFNAEAYVRSFADKDGKVWQGGGGRNPPPDAPHLVLTTPDIESLRPKSPPQKNQQQQSSPLSLITTANSANKRPAVNSPQNITVTPSLGLNQEASGSNPPTPVPWASPMGGLKGPDVGNDDKFLEGGYGANASCGQTVGDHMVDFDSHRPAVNLL